MKYSTVSTQRNLRLSTTPWNPTKIREEDSTHEDMMIKYASQESELWNQIERWLW